MNNRKLVRCIQFLWLLLFFLVGCQTTKIEVSPPVGDLATFMALGTLYTAEEASTAQQKEGYALSEEKAAIGLFFKEDGSLIGLDRAAEIGPEDWARRRFTDKNTFDRFLDQLKVTDPERVLRLNLATKNRLTTLPGEGGQSLYYIDVYMPDTSSMPNPVVSSPETDVQIAAVWGDGSNVMVGDVAYTSSTVSLQHTNITGHMGMVVGLNGSTSFDATDWNRMTGGRALARGTRIIEAVGCISNPGDSTSDPAACVKPDSLRNINDEIQIDPITNQFFNDNKNLFRLLRINWPITDPQRKKLQQLAQSYDTSNIKYNLFADAYRPSTGMYCSLLVVRMLLDAGIISQQVFDAFWRPGINRVMLPNGKFMTYVGGGILAPKALADSGLFTHYYGHDTQQGIPLEDSTVISDGKYRIKTVLSGHSFDIAGGSTANTAKLITYPANTGANQVFNIRQTGQRNVFEIKATHSGKCIDVPNNWGTPVPLWQWDCNNTPAQMWRIVKLPTGNYQIRAAGDRKCMNVYGASTQPGATVGSYFCQFNTPSNEVFSLERINEIPVGPNVTEFSTMVLSYANRGIAMNLNNPSGLFGYPATAGDRDQVFDFVRVGGSGTESEYLVRAQSNGWCLYTPQLGNFVRVSYGGCNASNTLMRFKVIRYSDHYMIRTASANYSVQMYAPQIWQAVTLWPFDPNDRDQWWVMPNGRSY